MDVHLYVYDLSRGLARQMSGSLLGVQIDAVYHTSLVFGGVEYFFGAGIQTSRPGMTHHGAPMEKINLGRTQLPGEVISEYLDSLRTIYTPESYDLFLHNCNNFSNDFAMFLVGKGIPEHITSLPQTVLDTPFGQMLKPQLDQAMRGVTQAPMPTNGLLRGTNQATNNNVSNGTVQHAKVAGTVFKPSTLQQLDQLLDSAKEKCAVIFFTSSTCPPCKLMYPIYDELAASLGNKAVLIKVDVGEAFDIGSRYQIRATPTFISLLKGEQENQWTGANEAQLRGNVNLLLQMAYPAHPHNSLNLPTLRKSHKQPVTYPKIPPLDKLLLKLGPPANEPPVQALKSFISTRQTSGAADSPLPSLPSISSFLAQRIKTAQSDSLFPLIDLFRIALNDPRVSGFFAEDTQHTVATILSYVTSLPEETCPYQLRIVTLHLACNLFTSPIFPPKLLSPAGIYSSSLIQLVTSSLLDAEHAPVRVAAASLAFNITAFNHGQRLSDDQREDLLSAGDQVELLAGLLQALSKETENKDSARGMVLAIGLLALLAPVEGSGAEMKEVAGALEAKGTMGETKRRFGELEGLVGEVELVLK